MASDIIHGLKRSRAPRLRETAPAGEAGRVEAVMARLAQADPDPKAACQKIYDKITRRAEHLVATGEAIEREFGIPIVNKRISVTPMALVAGASETSSYVPFAVAMDR